MAVANSLAAVQAGARQVECTINGIGERAGNCALEEVVMALRTRSDLFGISTGIDTDATVCGQPSRFAHHRLTGRAQQGGRRQNAFAHEAGIHQHGVMQDARTYEVMRPQDVGVNATEFVLGKHSGRHAIAKRAQSLGFTLDDAALAQVFAAFKLRADDIGETGRRGMRCPVDAWSPG